MLKKGELQYVDGIGNFEWDGESWYRQIDDIRYTDEKMHSVLVQNDQLDSNGVRDER